MTDGMTDDMNASKITISLNSDVLQNLDQLVKARIYPNRSQAIQAAVQEKITRLRRTRLERECAKLDPHEEQAVAELGMDSEIEQWPTY